MKTFRTDINGFTRYSIEGVTFKAKSDRLIKDGHRTWRLTTHETEEGIILYSFGVTDERNPPGHGGEWSSRADVINDVFDCNLFDIVVDGWSCAIDKDEFSVLNRALNTNIPLSQAREELALGVIWM